MKKSLLCIISVLLLIPITALANVDSVIEHAYIEYNAVEPMASELSDPIERVVTCYEPVTYKQVLDDDVVINETTYYEPVATIKYRYRVSINSLGKYTGGVVVVSKGWPEIEAISSSILNPTVTMTDEPTGYVIPINDGAGYKVSFYGGSISITYNNVIYKNIYNEVLDSETETATVTRVFSYNETGP